MNMTLFWYVVVLVRSITICLSPVLIMCAVRADRFCSPLVVKAAASSLGVKCESNQGVMMALSTKYTVQEVKQYSDDELRQLAFLPSGDGSELIDTGDTVPSAVVRYIGVGCLSSNSILPLTPDLFPTCSNVFLLPGSLASLKSTFGSLAANLAAVANKKR
jgi:hypothetical protein